jgi:hypothetical protein
LVQVSSLIGENSGRLSVREVTDLNERTQLFEGFAGYAYTRYNFNGNGGLPENFIVTRTTHQLFDILGVQLTHGRPWAAIYDRTRSFEIVLGHDLWVRRFAADPAIVGQSVLMDGYPNRIAGVLPPGIGFPRREVVYRTWGIATNPQNPARSAGGRATEVRCHLRTSRGRTRGGVASARPGSAGHEQRLSICDAAASRRLRR